MIIKPSFEYPVVDRVTNADGTRFYTCPETGQPLPSVTTILSATADKTGLELWREAVGERKAARITLEACNLGTLMHTNLENHIQGLAQIGGGHPLRMQARRMADVIIEKAFPKVDEVWGMEVPMYYPGLYAGTTDLVGLHAGVPAIMDYKTTRKMKSRDMIVDYFCQTAAYCMAHDEVYGTSMKRGVIFMVARDLQYQEYVIEGDQLEHYKAVFLGRVEAYFEKMAA